MCARLIAKPISTSSRKMRGVAKAAAVGDSRKRTGIRQRVTAWKVRGSIYEQLAHRIKLASLRRSLCCGDYRALYQSR